MKLHRGTKIRFEKGVQRIPLVRRALSPLLTLNVRRELCTCVLTSDEAGVVLTRRISLWLARKPVAVPGRHDAGRGAVGAHSGGAAREHAQQPRSAHWPPLDVGRAAVHNPQLTG